MLDFIAKPMGLFLLLIYNTVAFHNYGIAIILFTLVVKLFLLPLAIKQYQSSSKLQELQPQIQEIQRRYKNDKDKMNQEMLKLYQENKVNPAGGCLPLLIQMPILFSLYWVISSPLYYMFNKSKDAIKTLFDLIPVDAVERIANLRDISIINYFHNHPEQLSKTAGLLKVDELLNLNFLGIFNLGMIPSIDIGKLFGPLSYQYIPLFFIPVLAAVTTYISIKFSTPKTSAQNANNQMQNSMAMIMPFVTAFFAFSVPAGLGLYWIISNLVQILQQAYLNKFIIKQKEVGSK